MFKKIYLLLIIGTVVSLTSCDMYPTDTNNNLKTLNKVKIQNIKKVYNVRQGRQLNIKPHLVLSKGGQKQNFKYLWFTLDNSSPPQADTLATTRNLNITVKLDAGNYKVFYTVTNKKSGVHWRTNFKLNVKTLISEGWLVLSGVNGNARLDMVSLFNGKYHHVTSVLDVVFSDLKLKGAPMGLISFGTHYASYGRYRIFITTKGNGTTRIKPQTFGWNKNMLLSNYLLYEDFPVHVAADKMLYNPNGSGFFVFLNGYVYKDESGAAVNTFGLPLALRSNNEKIKVAPYIAMGTNSNLFYDKENKRFLTNAVGNVQHFVKLTGNNLFDYSDVGMNMVFMTHTAFNGGQAIAILKDPASSDYYLARIQNLIQLAWGKMKAPELNKAEHFAVSPLYGYIFYSVNGKVYEYDYGTGKTTLMFNKAGKQITFMNFIRGTFANPLSTYNDLIIGVYDPSLPVGKRGSLEIYKVPSLNKQITLKKKFTGFGKIKDIDYRTRYK